MCAFAPRAVSPANAAEFLALSNVVCVGGSWLVPGSALKTGTGRRSPIWPRPRTSCAHKHGQKARLAKPVGLFDHCAADGAESGFWQRVGLFKNAAASHLVVRQLIPHGIEHRRPLPAAVPATRQNTTYPVPFFLISTNGHDRWRWQRCPPCRAAPNTPSWCRPESAAGRSARRPA